MKLATSSFLDRPDTRFFNAIAQVAVAFGIRVLIVRIFGTQIPPYITFYPAVMFVAVLAGLWPGILATVLSALVVDYFVLPPIGTFAILSRADIVSMTLFVAMGVQISAVIEYYRRGQRKLKESAEAQLPLFIEQAPAALAMFDRKMTYLRASLRWKSQYGMGEHDPRDVSLFTLTPQIAEKWRDAYRRGLAGETLRCEAQCFELPDGTTEWMRWEIHPWNDSTGEIGGIIIFAEDITERKRIEAQLQQIIRTYSVLSDINQTIVREKDRALMFSAACRIAVDKGKFRMAWVGIIDPVTGKLTSITSSGDEEGYLDSVGVNLSGEQEIQDPVESCLRSGTTVVCNDIESDSMYEPCREKALKHGYQSSAAFPLTLRGKVLGAFVLYAGEPGFFDERELLLLEEMAMDVSFALEVEQREVERRKVEEELKWRTAFFEAQMESSRDGIMVKDDQGKVIFRNRSFAKVLGMPESIAQAEDSSAQVEFLLSRTKNRDQLIASTRRIQSNPDLVSQDDFELFDGTLITRFTSPVTDEAGRHFGRLWIFQDLTERRKLERQLRQSQKMEAVGQLTGGIAHDFNNLLAIVLGNLELLAPMLKGNDAALRRLLAAQMASQRGADVTRRLLSFSQSGDIKPEPVKIQACINNVIGLARTIGPDVQFCLECDEGTPAVMVDASGFENALLNLIVNARDAAPHGGIITISTRLTTLEETDPLVQTGELNATTHACVVVSDTGVGMSKEVLERVFEPFFTTKPKGKGTGLGLAMVYGFVKQSGGAIRIQSEPGQGTTVIMYLPLVEAEPMSTVSVPVMSNAEKRSHKILLVDDEPDVTELAEIYLQALGHRVFRAESADDALTIVREQSDLTLLVTDVIMPGTMNGVELAQRVRKELPHIKVIYSSGYPSDAMIDRGLPVIDGPLLRKPYRRRDFEEAVRIALT